MAMGEFSGFAPDTMYNPTSKSGKVVFSGNASEIVIDEFRGRKLVTDFRRSGIWDKTGYAEYWYLGFWFGDEDAVCRWRGWLRSNFGSAYE